jgi:hypothetical protein
MVKIIFRYAGSSFLLQIQLTFNREFWNSIDQSPLSPTLEGVLKPGGNPRSPAGRILRVLYSSP